MIEEEDNPEDLFLNVLDNNLDINKKDRVRKNWRVLIDAFRTYSNRFIEIKRWKNYIVTLVKELSQNV